MYFTKAFLELRRSGFDVDDAIEQTKADRNAVVATMGYREEQRELW